LRPFSAINPCGYAGLRITQTKDLGIDDEMEVLGQKMIEKLQIKLAEGGNIQRHDH
jgi:lipoyl(octanoyl) transferase